MSDDVAPDTVTEAVALLRRQGYTAEFELGGDALDTGVEGQACPVERAEVERLYRFEGPSDPGDEMVVFGLRDPATGIRGTLATAFGPSAPPDIARHLSGLRSRFRGA